jgi:Cu(I)/Ag(I) efflux system membrane protein CusA/SilA
VIARWIDLCARNRFLVFTAMLFLVLAGVWSARRIPLDALPDISDVQVIIHTTWVGEPPNIIEDQVTYPIVTSLLAAPHVKAVRAQTMFGDSYVFVIFEDGTDLYWARSRVLEYLQRIGGRLPAAARPEIGPDATGAGWIYEYLIVDHNHRHSLADLRSLQDWFLRYQIETVPGVAEVASIGGFVKQYQVRLDPAKLRAFSIPLATVIEKVRDSSNEVGGRLIELQGAEYMVRGLGYLRSLSDLESVPVGAKNGTPILVRDLGTVSFGPDIRRGVAEWNGEGETVGGIVVMRHGLNALNVISGVKKKLAAIAASLPPGVEIVSGYDRSGLIEDSIHTLERDLIEEAIIVSLVIAFFLFHFRSALVPILILPIGVLASFIPMYYLQISSNIMSLGGLALAIGVLVDAAIVMVENGYRRLSEAQHQGHDGESGPRRISSAERRRILLDAAKQVGPALFFSLLIIVVSFLPVFLLEAQEGRMFRPLAWTKTFAVGFSSLLTITLAPPLVRSRRAAAGGRQSRLPDHAGALLAGLEALPALSEDDGAAQSCLPSCDRSARVQIGKPVHAAALRGRFPLHADGAPRNLDRPGYTAAAGAGPDSAFFPRGGERVRFHRPLQQRDRQRSARYVRHHGDAKTAQRVASGHDLRKADLGNGRQAAIPGTHQHLDNAHREPPGYGAHRDQDPRGH